MGIWVLNEQFDFAGAATTPGDPFGPWAQVGVSGQYLFRDGSGNLQASSPSAPCDIWKGGGPGYNRAIEADTVPWDASFAADGNCIWDLQLRLVDPVTAPGGGGTFTNDYGVRFRSNHNLSAQHGETALNSNSWGVPINGHVYTIRGELRGDGIGGTDITAKVFDKTADPTLALVTVPANDTTSNLNSSSGTYDYGFACRGSAFVGSGTGWGITAIRAYDYVANAPPGTVASGSVFASGFGVQANISSLGAPMQPAKGSTGWSVRARAAGISPWVNFPVNYVTISNVTALLALITPIPAGWTAQVSYSSVTGNVTDTLSDTPVPLSSATNLGLTNNSTYAAVTGPNTGEIIASTRGNGRTGPDATQKNKQAATKHRWECPYGVKAGTLRIPFLGYSDGSSTLINLLGAALWVQQAPGNPIAKIPLTFSGASSATVSPNQILEADRLPLEILPGAVCWSTTWYTNNDPTVGLPCTSIWLDGYEYDGAGTDSDDGTLAGTTLSDPTIVGGFSHDLIQPLTSGADYTARGWRPICLYGEKHPSYVGEPVVLYGIGDSILIGNDGNKGGPSEPDRYAARGFLGIACANTTTYILTGNFGSSASGYTGSTNTPVFYFIHGNNADKVRKVTHGLNEFGINITTTEPVAWYQSQRLDPGVILHAHGIKFTQTTLTPRNDIGAGQALFTSRRATFNDRVRAESDNAHMPGCIGYNEVCNGIEVSFATNTNTATGGMGTLHPNDAATYLMAGDIDLTVYSNSPNPVPIAAGAGTSAATLEVGAGNATNIPVGSGQVIIGPWQSIDRDQMRIKVHARGTLAFHLNYEFSTDKGMTWYVGEQVSASTVSVDDGVNYAKEAHGHFNAGYWWRISVFNMDASNPLDIAFEWRLHAY